MPACVSCVFHLVLVLEQDVGHDPPLPPPRVLHRKVLLGGSSRGMASSAGISAWELGGGVGKPKIQPSSVVTLHHKCSALLPYLMLSFWNYSPVPQVTFPLLSEHSGSESAAFLGTAALGVFLPQRGWGQGGAWTLSALRALREGESGSWQDCATAAPGRDFK